MKSRNDLFVPAFHFFNGWTEKVQLFNYHLTTAKHLLNFMNLRYVLPLYVILYLRILLGVKKWAVYLCFLLPLQR